MGKCKISGKRMKKITEFSKKFIFIAALVWIIGAGFGGIVIIIQLIAVLTNPYSTMMVDLSSYLTYLAVPLSCGIVGYMAKAAFENREKIKQGYIAPDIGAESENVQ